jgi:pentatricopeptide repeat protein
MGEKDEAKPDARLYNLMMHTYGKAGKLSEQQALFRQMKGSGVPMTAVTFNSLMAFQKTVADAEACLRHVWSSFHPIFFLFFPGLLLLLYAY